MFHLAQVSITEQLIYNVSVCTADSPHIHYKDVFMSTVNLIKRQAYCLCSFL